MLAFRFPEQHGSRDERAYPSVTRPLYVRRVVAQFQVVEEAAPRLSKSLYATNGIVKPPPSGVGVAPFRPAWGHLATGTSSSLGCFLGEAQAHKAIEELDWTREHSPQLMFLRPHSIDPKRNHPEVERTVVVCPRELLVHPIHTAQLLVRPLEMGWQ